MIRSILSLEKPFQSIRCQVCRSIVKATIGLLLLLQMVIGFSAPPSSPNAFTYQGRLTARGLPVNGQFDLQLMLFHSMNGPERVDLVLTNENVAVSNGLFTTTLDFGPQIFNGLPYFLEVAVRPSGLAGEGFGNPLLPRQKITAAPYALYAVSAGFADHSSNAVTAATAATANHATTAGFALTASNATTASFATRATNATTADVATTAKSVSWTNVLDKPPGFADGVDNDTETIYAAGPGLELNENAFSVDSSIARLNNVWQLGGNSGATPGLNFIGTTDTNALEFKVNGLRAVRLEPHTNGPNVIAGADANGVATGIGGASIGGGRDNRVLANAGYATIPGGLGARARSFGQLTHASGSFPSGFGEAQASVYVLRNTTVGNMTKELYLDASSKRMIVPTSGVWTFDVLAVAATTNNAETAGFRAQGVVKHDGSTVSLVGTNRIVAMPISGTFPPAGWTLEITVPNVANPGDPESALVIRAAKSGFPPDQTIRWVATVRTAELIHAPPPPP